MKSASSHLLLHLESLSNAMLRPSRNDFTKGRVVKRKARNWTSYSYRFSSGMNSVTLSQVDVSALKELGRLLLQVSNGCDARKVFAQNKRTKPTKTGEHQSRALAYWSVRALNPRRKDTAAVLKAKKVIQGGLKLSDWTIRKIAQRYREDCIRFLSLGETIKPVKPKNARLKIVLRSHEQVEALRSYLRRKSARLNADMD